MSERTPGEPGAAEQVAGAERPALDQLPNLRDVAAADPRLRPGVLWRSAAPQAGDVAPTAVVGWPPHTVVDLRSAFEFDGEHPLVTDGTALHSVELLDEAGSPEALARREPTLAEVYLSMLDPGEGLVRAVTLLADEPAPVLVHCAAGKDRTGLVVALALRLVGVGREAVTADYLLTTAAMPAVLARIFAKTPLPPGVTLDDLPRGLIEASTDALAVALDAWDEHPGGVPGWVTARGGDPELPARLRSRLLA